MKLVCAQIEVAQFDEKLNFERMRDVILAHQYYDFIVFPSHLVGESYVDALLSICPTATLVWGDKESMIYVAQKGVLLCRLFDNGMGLIDPASGNDVSDFTFEIKSEVYGFYAGDFRLKIGFIPYQDMDDEDYDLFVNGVGMIDQLKNISVVIGGSYFKSKYYLNDIGESEVAIIELDKFNIVNNKSSEPFLGAVLAGIFYFDKIALPFVPKWIVGVSGGLDSSVTSALISMALGQERVLGISMPGDFTRDITKDYGQSLQSALGIEFKTLPIKSLVEATLDTLEDYPEIKGLALENIQARQRGHILMSVASLENGVVSNNGNKLEAALGYATLYGDAIGALGILGDLTKLQVGELARAINRTKDMEVIPFDLIPVVLDEGVQFGFKPSAELSIDQFDPMKWGYHDHLLELIMRYGVEEVLSLYLKTGFENMDIFPFMKQYEMDQAHVFVEDFKWVVGQLEKATFKRIQFPTILVMSQWPFRDTSQTQKLLSEKAYSLISEILNNTK